MRLFVGDCIEVLPTLSESSIDAVVTDPPYGLSFMGKQWDHGVPGRPFWEQALRVTKPGGMLLAFGGTRTHHRLMVAIEDAGWEIRDCLMWLYGTGFPKSHNISKAIDKSAPATDAAKTWEGYGTALKPAWEPIILAMKPCDGTFASNALKHGVAGLSIDGCRIGEEERPNIEPDRGRVTGNSWQGGLDGSLCGSKAAGTTTKGRYPANVILDEEAGALLDEQSGRASRFFYCSKASKKERGKGNKHPTVKPLALMRWLCRLVKTSTGGKILDPFMGSGTTGIAALQEGMDFVGIEQEAEYVEIAKHRVAEEQNV